MYKTQVQQLRKLDKQQYQLLRKLCWHSARLYNFGLYQTRQEWFQTKTFLRYADNYHRCKDNENYQILPSVIGQHTLKLVDRGMRSFLGLLKATKENGQTNPIRPPQYLPKDKHFMLIIPSNGFQIKDNKLYIGISLRMKTEFELKNLKFNFPKHVDPKTVKEVRIHPKHNAHYFTMEMVYEVEEKEKNGEDILGIDIGLNNLATCWDNKNSRALIIDGRKIKSINHYYNKQNAKLQSIKDKQGLKHFTKRQFLNTRKRSRRIKDYMHKAARKIVNYAVEHNIGKIVVGHNVGWKNEINFGKKNNQNFVQVPFGMLMSCLQYKCQEEGIEYQEICESHTSKCSFLDCESIKHHDKYMGQRVKRGLFKTAKGVKVNADVNGAANIARKVTGDYSLNSDQIKGFLANPVRLN